VLDSSYRTGSIVSFMPLLFGLAVWGTVGTIRRGVAAVLPLVGPILIPGAVLAAPYITHRYTAEFLPWLVVGGVLGAVALVGTLAGVRRQRREQVLWVLAVVAVFGVAANLAVGVTAQAQANPGPTLADYVHRQDQVSGWFGGSIDDDVAALVQLPPEGPPDAVRIVGPCDSMYEGTGEHDHPWAEVGTRELTFDATWDGRVVDPGSAQVARFVGHHTVTLAIEWQGDGRFRLTLTGGGLSEESEWSQAPIGEPQRFRLATDDPDEYLISFGDGELHLPKQFPDADFVNLPNVLVPELSGTLATGASVEVQPVETPELDACTPLFDRYRERVGTSEDPPAGG
jgi:hypothetical protein